MRFTVDEIAASTQGVLAVPSAHPEEVIEGFTWDSRACTPGCLYVALVGERVDGHDFALKAAQAGARCVLAMRELEASMLEELQSLDVAVIRVDDTVAALVDLARAWRARLRGRVVCVTGSTGKTSTKNLVRDVLSARFSVVATQANQNNELGVPRTLLRAQEDTDFVVVEMGMRGLHQLEELCAFVRPDWGLVTNVGESHIELLGSRENIARAKAEVIEALPDGEGIAFLNDVDDYCEAVRSFAALDERGISTVRFSTQQPGAEGFAVWAQDVVFDALGAPSFTLCANYSRDSRGACALEPDVACVPCKLSLRGMHSVSNACSAAAVGLAAGMELHDIADALQAAQVESGRGEILEAKGGYLVLDDAYNANPDSMRASLAAFRAMEVDGRRIAVLGDMGELGDYAVQLHEEVGRFAAGLGLDNLVCVGELAKRIADAACEAGMDAERVTWVESVEKALEWTKALVGFGDAVLVKASHFMELTKVVEGLVD